MRSYRQNVTTFTAVPNSTTSVCEQEPHDASIFEERPD